MYAINEQIECKFLLINPATGQVATGKTVTAIVYDETDTQFSTPTVTEIGGGLYTTAFTPDTAGEWTVRFYCADPVQYGAATFPVGKGVETAVKTVADAIKLKTDTLPTSPANETTNMAIKAKTDLIPAAPANEATLTAIKGAGWGSETLKAIYDYITTQATKLDLLENKLKAIPSVDSILWKTGGALAPTGKSIWDALGDGSVSINTLNTLLAHSTYGLSALNTDLDALLARLTATRAGYLDNLSGGATALEATLTAIKGAGWTTQTLKQISEAIAAISVATPQQVWEYGTRSLTDKAGFTISGSKTTLDALQDISAAAVNAQVDLALDTPIPSPTADSINERIKTMDDDLQNGGRLDLLIDQIKAKTDQLPTDPADESLLEALLDTLATPADVETAVENASSAAANHSITTANDKTETQVVELAKTGIYALSVYLDLDELEAAAEGGTVSVRVYNKVDASYGTKPIALSEYTVGTSKEYPSIEIGMIKQYCKVTIQCSGDVTTTRTIPYRYIYRDLGT